MILPMESHDDSELDYQLCELPGSRLQFRGPLPEPGVPYVTVLGGTESFGKYVDRPFSALLAEWIGCPVVNFGVPQAGLTLFGQEQPLLDFASAGAATVLQVLGAQNMSNRLYRVHARRNDRFVGISPALRELYPQVDFTEIHFTGHLMTRLCKASPTAFQVVVEELRWAWLRRMKRVVSLIGGKVILLWISEHAPKGTPDMSWGEEPNFIDRSMIDQLRDDVVDIVVVVLPPSTELEGKIFPAHETGAARLMPGPAAHAQIAEALVDTVSASFEEVGRSSAATHGDNVQSFSISSGTAVNKSATKP